MSRDTRRWLWLTAAALLAAAAVMLGRGDARAERPDLSFEITCTPNTFRPDVWAAVECTTYVTNHGSTPLTGSTNIIAEEGGIPRYFFIQHMRDEEAQPLLPGQLSTELPEISPGETIVTRTLLLLKLQEGTFRARTGVTVGDDDVDQMLVFKGDPDASEPSNDVEMTQRLEDDSEGEVEAASYETIITNNTSETLSDLSVISRVDSWGTTAIMDPGPAVEEEDGAYARWTLDSFGRKSLAPGESLVLRTRYEMAPGNGCSSVSPAVVVQTQVGGERRSYGSGPEESAMLGDCGFYAEGEGGQIAFGRGGEGPLGASNGFATLPAALASLGLALAAGGCVLRRHAVKGEA